MILEADGPADTETPRSTRTNKIPPGWKRAQTTTVGKWDSIWNNQDGHFTGVKITFLTRKHAACTVARKESSFSAQCCRAEVTVSPPLSAVFNLFLLA